MIAHQQDQFYDSRCGEFRAIFDEFIAVASLSRRAMPSVRSGLSIFLLYVNEQGIHDLNDVTGPTITSFLKWGDETGRAAVWDAVWPVKSFFNWLIVTGQC
jgi:site-specific recombinase XerD